MNVTAKLKAAVGGALDLAGLRTGIQAIGARVREIEATVEQAKREREQVAAAPRTREETIAELERWVEMRRATAAEQFARQLA